MKSKNVLKLLNVTRQTLTKYVKDKKIRVNNGIGNIVVGYNRDWKDSIRIGHRNNQTFVSIPYLKLIQYLEYKCNLIGINLILHEEGYTSKCDSLTFEKIEKHDVYSGKRIKRGLFQSGIGKLINADVNGSINILRKVVDDSVVKTQIINSGLLFNPIKYNNLYNLNCCVSERVEFSYISSNRFLQRCGLKSPELDPVAGTLYYIFDGKSFKKEEPYILKDKTTGKNVKLKAGQVWIYKENPKKKGTMCWYLFSRSNQELEVENGTHALSLI